MREFCVKWVRSPVFWFVACGVLICVASAVLAFRFAPRQNGHAQYNTTKIITGSATVIDGDTIDIAGKRIRLEGIDAPETGQWCPYKVLGSWPCGKAATQQLTTLTSGHELTCQDVGRGKYGRILGICRIENNDINAQMVRSGYAWAFVKYSRAYLAEEQEARSQNVGIWSGAAALPPWKFREKSWARAEQTAPKGCAIKGNNSSRGRIYHMPWSPWYHRVRINRGKGERWFCTETEAQLAGWRAVNHY